MSSKTLVACFLVLMLVALNLAIAQTTLPSLVGSWEFTATPDTAASAPAPSIDGLATFTSDGTVVETDTIGLLGRVSPGHGIWQIGPIPGGYLFVRFMSLMPNLNGTLQAKRIVTVFLTVNSTGDQFSGTYEFEIVNSKEAVISTGAGKVVGKLMTHPPLP